VLSDNVALHWHNEGLSRDVFGLQRALGDSSTTCAAMARDRTALAAHNHELAFSRNRLADANEMLGATNRSLAWDNSSLSSECLALRGKTSSLAADNAALSLSASQLARDHAREAFNANRLSAVAATAAQDRDFQLHRAELLGEQASIQASKAHDFQLRTRFLQQENEKLARDHDIEAAAHQQFRSFARTLSIERDDARMQALETSTELHHAASRAAQLHHENLSLANENRMIWGTTSELERLNAQLQLDRDHYAALSERLNLEHKKLLEENAILMRDGHEALRLRDLTELERKRAADEAAIAKMHFLRESQVREDAERAAAAARAEAFRIGNELIRHGSLQREEGYALGLNSGETRGFSDGLAVGHRHATVDALDFFGTRPPMGYAIGPPPPLPPPL
jgi:predicted DNA-binding protein (UPF0251 family)